MDQCPECGNRRFVSKLLVYEVTGYDEGGEQDFRRQHVRAEFEYTCSECQTTLRTLPADRRDYYDEVAVLETERRAALRDQLRQLGRRVWQRLAARTTWLALGFVTLVTGLVIAL
jgi:DNA-directed RNA polymerase subunit RPC12/RpoP